LLVPLGAAHSPVELALLFEEILQCAIGLDLLNGDELVRVLLCPFQELLGSAAARRAFE
jgi:hypothetical protein